MVYKSLEISFAFELVKKTQWGESPHTKRGGAVVARLFHKQEVDGANPSPATKT